MDLKRKRGVLGSLLVLHRVAGGVKNVKDLPCASTRGEHRCLYATRTGTQKNGKVGEMQFLVMKHITSFGSFD